MVERVLAKDETGVRFSLSAPREATGECRQFDIRIERAKRPNWAVFAFMRFYGELCIKVFIVGIKDVRLL